MATRAIGNKEDGGRTDQRSADMQPESGVDGEQSANFDDGEYGAQPSTTGGAPDHPRIVRPTDYARKGVKEPGVGSGKWKRRKKLKRKPVKVGSTSPGDTTSSTTTTKQTASQIDLSHLLFSAHLMLAAITKQPSIILTEEEAVKVADAVNRVGELYDAPFLDEKARALLNLGMVGVEVYGTRIAASFFDSRRNKPHVVTPIKQATQPNAESYTDGEVVSQVGQVQ